MKLLMTTIAASILFSGAALAADTWPILANMSGVLATTGANPPESATLVDIAGLNYYSSGRAAGRVPPKPDSVSVTVDDRGRTSTTSTWVKK
jgi:hypothetical protein